MKNTVFQTNCAVSNRKITRILVALNGRKADTDGTCEGFWDRIICSFLKDFGVLTFIQLQTLHYHEILRQI
jgi:hypothetical protein